ncbi:MAG: hypothetical protein KDK90_27820, partial [Leptospiraceae bacterium]|nr:hypothetical protein [Leptospiraceae bacterium]
NTPLGTNQYTYTEGNPVRFTDPSGYMPYASFVNRVTKDLTKAFITEVSKQGALASAGMRMVMTKMKISQEKKQKRDSNIQLGVSILKIIGGAILFSMGFVNIGVSLMASGLAGIAGYAQGGGAGRGHFDHAKATRTSKVASGIVSAAFFVYSFFDFTMDPDIEAGKEVVEAGRTYVDITWNPLTWVGYFIWNPIKWAFYEFSEIVSEMAEQDLFLLPTKSSWWIDKGPQCLQNAVGSFQAYNPNLTELLYSGLNYPGNIAWLLFDYTVYSDLMTYKPSITQYNSPDNPGYYYDQMIRKGLYYIPYTIDFIEGKGVFAR